MPNSADSRSRPRYRAIHRSNLPKVARWNRLARPLREAVEVVSLVLPFRTNEYVLEELIDWDRVPDDPIYQLTFPQRSMLASRDYDRMQSLLRSGASKEAIRAAADEVRLRLNPHPAGQTTHNVPRMDGRRLEGIQHKYRETVLFFPARGQTCHAYCTFCFRWPQFVAMEGMRFSGHDSVDLVRYLSRRPEVTDVLFTGGDPMVMRSEALCAYIDPLLSARLEHVQTLRIGTKSVAYWPQRYVTDPDADDLLRLFERIVRSGRHLAIMGHYSHPRELSTPIAQAAVRRILSTGAQIRMQSPLVHRVNDDPGAWVELWSTGVRLGMIPYYMFVERDTGPRQYFEVPLVRAWSIFQAAYQQVSGLARTVRGPSMSAFPGKVLVDGIASVAGKPVFCLQFLQARQKEWVRRPFFAEWDPKATWLDQLRPAFGAEKFFFEDSERVEPRHLRVLPER